MSGARVLRVADEGDMTAIMPVMDQAFDSRHGEAWTREQCLATLILPGYRWFVCEDRAGSACGFLLSRSVVAESEMMLLAVHPDQRRRGIGRALIGRWVEDARGAGVERLYLEVRENNPALRIYRDFGFIENGRRPDYYRGDDGHRYAAISMSFILLGRV